MTTSNAALSRFESFNSTDGIPVRLTETARISNKKRVPNLDTHPSTILSPRMYNFFAWKNVTCVDKVRSPNSSFK